MAGFYRKGTVSKASGPTHIDSYALKSIPIRYKPPLFVPEINHLPVNGQVTMPPESMFAYNYSLENRVLDQARTRARSIASEASLERRKKELQESQQQTPPLHQFLASDTILTPIPVANNTSNTSQTGSDSSRKTSQTGLTSTSESGGGDDGTQTESNANSSAIKSLGQLSIREFEGDNLDPFEITSLQAINDLEVLQSVLQPTVAPTSTPSPIIAHHPPSSNLSQSGDTLLQSSSSGIVQSTAVVAIATQQSIAPTPLPRSASQPSSSPKPAERKISEPSPAVTVPPPSTSTASVPGRSDSGPIVDMVTQPTPPPPHDLFLTSSSPAVVVTSNPFASQTPTSTLTPYPLFSQPPSSTSSTVTNPFVVASGTPMYVASSVPPVTAPTTETSGGPSVGTLIEIGSSAPCSTDQLPTPPVPAVRNSPPIQAGQAPPPYPTSTAAQPQGIPPSQSSPVPKPRTHLPPSPSTQPRPLSAGERLFVNGPPAPAAVQPHPPPVGPKPSSGPPPSSVSPQLHPRFGLGVPVLPPIPTATSAPPPVVSSAQPLSHTAAASNPPPYKPQPSPPTQRSTPPPPYQPYDQQSQQQQQQQQRGQRSPAVTPRQYKLPDLQSSLTSEQKTEVSSIAGMGFPPPRVARAVLRYDGDRSKVLDFLFLVGNLEELRFSGDSAETALLACDEKIDKAKEYLNKVDQFKGMGFGEKAIHESYNKTKGDWDKVLDLLITAAR